MKTIIAGSRTFTEYTIVQQTLSSLDWTITEVVSGHARGADHLGERWATEEKIPYVVFAAEWNRYGKRAGLLRNKKMAQYAKAAVIFWDGSSKGSQHMIRLAHQYQLIYKVVRV